MVDNLKVSAREDITGIDSIISSELRQFNSTIPLTTLTEGS